MNKCGKMVMISTFISLISLGYGLLSTSDSRAIHNMVLTTIKMLIDCDLGHKTLVMSAEIMEYIWPVWVNWQPIAVILLDNSSVYNHTLALEHQSKAHIMVMALSSTDGLYEELSAMKDSAWWSIMTSFFLVGKFSNASCEDSARSILKIATHMDIVKAYFVCKESKDHLDLYAYNSHCNCAPCSWNLTEQIDDEPMVQDDYEDYFRPWNRWTMFHKTYPAKVNFCRDLYFERIHRNRAELKCCVDEIQKNCTWN